MSVIVTIRLETDLNEFTSTVTDGGDLYWDNSATAKAVAGAEGALACLIDDTSDVYGVKTITADTSGKLRFRFYYDPNTFGGSASDFYIIALRNSTPANIGFVSAYRSSGGIYRIRITAYNDVPATVESARYDISDAPHYVEVYLQRAATNSSADGSMQLWVDGTDAAVTLTGIDNYDRFPNFATIRMGPQAVGSGVGTGTIFFDELVINNDGELIGPLGNTYTETGGAISVLTASGADLLAFADTGQAITVLTASGVEIEEFTETGQATSVLTASGVEAETLTETGQAITVLTASGAEVETLTETGQATTVLTATGIETVTITEIGNAISVLTASGADLLSFVDTGQATIILTGTGADLLTTSGIEGETLTGTGRWPQPYRIPEAIYDDEDAIFLIMLALLLGRNAEIKL